MVADPFFWSVFGVLLLQRLFELSLSQRNARWMQQHGGREYGREHFRWIVWLMIGFFVALPLEYGVRHAHASPRWHWWITLLLLAQILRYWAIASLGRHWNVRIWVIPGAARIRRGPYRCCAHPNYLAVLLELAAVPLLFGCTFTALAGLTGYFFFLRTRIAAEERALEECRA